MLDLFDSLFDFDRNYYNFRRNEKDMAPYSIIHKKEENKIILVHNILGINKEDLNVSVRTENKHKILYISGETKDEVTGQNYSINSRFMLSDISDIEDISSECKNGLLYVVIKRKKIVPRIAEPKEQKIEIK